MESIPNKSQAERLAAGLEERGVLHILLANVEGFATKKLPAFMVSSFRAGKAYLLLMSPLLSRTPRPNALRTWSSSVRRLHTKNPHRIPVTKSPIDLYAQCGFMDKRLLGFDSYYSFQGRYAITRTQRMGSHSFNQVVGYRNLEELSNKLLTFSYRVTKEEALDLPDKIYTTRRVMRHRRSRSSTITR